jgi:hypothetical protein
LTVYILCSIRGAKRPAFRDDILKEAQDLVANNYGRALDGMDWRKLDLIAGGAAFVDLTDIKGLHLGEVFRARHVVDLWWRVKGRTFAPGRGYEEWVWQSVREYLRVSGEGGRAWRVMIG